MPVPTVARRAERIPPFEVMDVVRAARDRAGHPAPGPVCHLEVGQPSTPAPATVRDAARAALDGPLGYTDSLGLPELRGRIARWYQERHGSAVDTERIAVTTGASAGCVLAFLACFDPGDRVAVCEPGYPCYRHILEVLGVEVVALPIDAGVRYQPTPGALDALGPLDGVVVASPANPTGGVLRPDELDALTDWCVRTGTRLVADEIYHGITEGRPAPTAAGRPGVVVVQSCSKYFCMTGWRIGWLVLPEDLVRPVERLSQNLYLAPPTLSQHAAVAAFDATAELDGHVERYRANRHRLVDGLRDAGITGIAPAEGAFYVWADVGHLGDSGALCRRWLDELAVAATPGTDFDPQRGHRFVRFSVAGSVGEVAAATDRISAWLARNGPGA
jgi:aspartate/methionine/tyrosine aminotransferase